MTSVLVALLHTHPPWDRGSSQKHHLSSYRESKSPAIVSLHTRSLSGNVREPASPSDWAEAAWLICQAKLSAVAASVELCGSEAHLGGSVYPVNIKRDVRENGILLSRQGARLKFSMLLCGRKEKNLIKILSMVHLPWLQDIVQKDRVLEQCTGKEPLRAE